MPELMVQLPYPPSVNNYWHSRVVGKRPIVYVSASGKAYRAAVLKSLKGVKVPDWPDGARLDVSVAVYPPDRRKRDLDNPLKATLDALTAAGVWSDDSLIDRLLVHRFEVVPDGMLVVLVRDIKESI